MEGSPSQSWDETVSSLTGRSQDSVKDPHNGKHRKEDHSEAVDKHRKEDYSEAIAERKNKENDQWFLAKNCMELTEILEEENEFWVLQYRKEEGGFVPALKADEQDIFIDENHDSNTHYITYQEDETRREVNVEALAEESDHSGFLERENGDKAHPEAVNLEENPLDPIETDYERWIDEKDREHLNGRYIAPGLESFYRGRMEDTVQR